MGTEKLYYQDSHMTKFLAGVLRCEQVEAGFEAVLDRTAFYPEGGGQNADHGFLGGVPVLDVRERGDEIVHILSGPLAAGSRVEGEIDWPRRFSHMQHHTGEHIVSGLVHGLYGYDNVGFHMGADCVTIDFSGELTRGQIDEVERLANEAVQRDLPVLSLWPDGPALQSMRYRSKKELTGPVRIVEVPGCDVCACCGTHTRTTGEIGCIKLFGAVRHKGGTRMNLVCGARALADYREKSDSVYTVSALLSVKPCEVAGAVERLLAETVALRQRVDSLQGEILAARVAGQAPEGELLCLFEPGLTSDEVRRLCVLAMERAPVAAAFSPDGGLVRYALGSKSRDMRPLGKELNAAFSGRGGGKPELVQGNLAGEEEALRGFLKGRCRN